MGLCLPSPLPAVGHLDRSPHQRSYSFRFMIRKPTAPTRDTGATLGCWGLGEQGVTVSYSPSTPRAPPGPAPSCLERLQMCSGRTLTSRMWILSQLSTFQYILCLSHLTHYWICLVLSHPHIFGKQLCYCPTSQLGRLRPENRLLPHYKSVQSLESPADRCSLP